MSGIPSRTFLFSGHIVDAPDRRTRRFPASSEAAAARRIAESLEDWDAASGDLAFCSGAAGGDLLFAEACVARQLPLEILLPFPRDRFLAKSVDPSGGEWRRRFERLEGLASVTLEALEDAPGNAYARANHQLLRRACAWGADKLHLLVLWDGRPGDGVGGTADMVAAARRQTDKIRIIDPSDLGRT